MSKYDIFTIDMQSGSTHSKIIKFVGKNKSVLDVGCSAGYLSKFLIDNFDCKASGLEYDKEDAEKAAEFMDQVVVGNLETMDISKAFEKKFDCIVCADILEHLNNPKEVLKKLIPHCAGHFVISIPNITHSAVIYEMLEGKFDYRELGLLDNTHRTFLTIDSFEKMLNELDVFVTDIEVIRINPENTELKIDKSKFPKEVKDYINSKEYLNNYQYVIKAYPKDNLTNAELTNVSNKIISYKDKAAKLDTVTKELAQITNKADILEKDLNWHKEKFKEQLQIHYHYKTQKDQKGSEIKELADVLLDHKEYILELEAKIKYLSEITDRYNKKNILKKLTSPSSILNFLRYNVLRLK